VPPDTLESARAAPVAPPPAATTPRPYGFWATMGLGLACFAFWILIGGIVAMAFTLSEKIDRPALDVNSYVETLESNGLLLAVATMITAPACAGLLALFAWLRGWGVRDYLGLRMPPWRQTAVSLLALAALMVATDLVTHALGRPIVPEFMTKAYRSAGWLPLLVAALVVGAPVFEETFMRGFVFRGIAASRLGGVMAILLTAAFFALVHTQYDWYGKGTIFVVGLVFGGVRLWTGSVALTMLMHAVMNIVATVEAAVVVEMLN